MLTVRFNENFGRFSSVLRMVVEMKLLRTLPFRVSEPCQQGVRTMERAAKGRPRISHSLADTDASNNSCEGTYWTTGERASSTFGPIDLLSFTRPVSELGEKLPEVWK